MYVVPEIFAYMGRHRDDRGGRGNSGLRHLSGDEIPAGDCRGWCRAFAPSTGDTLAKLPGAGFAGLGSDSVGAGHRSCAQRHGWGSSQPIQWDIARNRATDSVCESCVVNSTFDDLNPFVSAFAMLLPMTAMAVSLQRQSVDGRVQRRRETHRLPPWRMACRARAGTRGPLGRLQSARAAAATAPCPWLSTGQALNPKSLC